MLSPNTVVADRYRVKRLIGEGGMGAVYAVVDETGARYALKVLLDATDENHTKRFLREATASSQITSPHVAKVHGSGVLDDGSPYILMELLDGEDLADLVGRTGPLAADEAVRLILPVLEALEQAHGLGIVHRDIKPANVFHATLPDGTRCVKLLDFGISKPTLTGIAPMTQLTQTGTVLGSPDYMAPEQLVSSSDVDARTDIWALGVTLHELLTARGAFGGTTLAELITSIMRDPPQPLREVRPELLPALEDIIKRCLEKDPELRFANVGELAAALRDVLPQLSAPLASARTQQGHMSPHAASEIATAATIASIHPAATAPTAVHVSSQEPQAPSPPPAKRSAWPLLLAGMIGFVIAIGAVIVISQAQKKDDDTTASTKRKKKNKNKKAKTEEARSKLPAKAKKLLDAKVAGAEKALNQGRLDESARLVQEVLDAIQIEHGLHIGLDRSRTASEAEHIRSRVAGKRFLAAFEAAQPGSHSAVINQVIKPQVSVSLYSLAAYQWDPSNPRCPLLVTIDDHLKVLEQIHRLIKEDAAGAKGWVELAVNYLRQTENQCEQFRAMPPGTPRCGRKLKKRCQTVKTLAEEVRKKIRDYNKGF